MEPQRIPGIARVVNVRHNDLTARARAAADVAKMTAAAVDAEADATFDDDAADAAAAA